jgi:hypothetical protein
MFLCTLWPTVLALTRIYIYLWFTHILRWYLYKVKCVIIITPSLFILKVVCCSTFLTGAEVLVTSSVRWSYYASVQKPEVLSFIVMFSVTIICPYPHMKFISVVLKYLGSTLLSHMGLYSFYHTPYIPIFVIICPDCTYCLILELLYT